MKQIFIIEHLEPKMWEWCVIEYKNISKIVGEENLWFTNVPRRDFLKIRKFGKVFEESVRDMKIENACLLDMENDKELLPKEAREFSYFIFGGILGDNPPRKRTFEELTRFMKDVCVRNIGKSQFSTDSAVFVVREICSGKKLKEIKFVDEIEVNINKIESTSLPYKYPLKNGKPIISKELIRYLKKH